MIVIPGLTILAAVVIAHLAWAHWRRPPLQDHLPKVVPRHVGRATTHQGTERAGTAALTPVGAGHDTVPRPSTGSAELLVLGSHGYGAFGDAPLGSVSIYCVHYARSPGHRHPAGQDHPGATAPVGRAQR